MPLPVRIERLELAHLRALVAEYQVELDDLRQRLAYAEDCAEHWREDALQTIEHAGEVPGLTMCGHVVALPPG